LSDYEERGLDELNESSRAGTFEGTSEPRNREENGADEGYKEPSQFALEMLGLNWRLTDQDAGHKGSERAVDTNQLCG
jgi:hypothetical protein